MLNKFISNIVFLSELVDLLCLWLLTISGLPIPYELEVQSLLRLFQRLCVQLACLADAKQPIVLIDRPLQIFQHICLSLLKIFDPLIYVPKLRCDLTHPGLLILILYHLLQLLMEEASLLQLPLFSPDVLCLLELLRHLSVLLLPSDQLQVLLLFLLLLPLSFELNHVFIGCLQL